MSLFKIEIINDRHSCVTIWKEKPTGKKALEYAQEQAIDMYGEGADVSCRYNIVEEKPVA